MPFEPASRPDDDLFRLLGQHQRSWWRAPGASSSLAHLGLQRPVVDGAQRVFGFRIGLCDGVVLAAGRLAGLGFLELGQNAASTTAGADSLGAASSTQLPHSEAQPGGAAAPAGSTMTPSSNNPATAFMGRL